MSLAENAVQGGPMTGPLWKFGSAIFDESALRLSVGGVEVELERKPLEVLRFLLAHRGKAVSKDQVVNAVWPGRILSETVIKKCISRLREVLGDADQSMIKTLHGYGYRLDVPVQMERRSSSPPTGGERVGVNAQVRECVVLIVDIAGTMALRSRLGDAAGGRIISRLLEEVITLARGNGGHFIKSYGDDVMAVFELKDISAAGRTAISAQQMAREAGVQLYAGFHHGEVEFRETMGHPDALGLTVNLAARLHKLTEGAPGRIFLAEDTRNLLDPELRARTARYGSRELKGIGQVSIWTLDWEDSASTTTKTVFSVPDAEAGAAVAGLSLSHGQNKLRVDPVQRSCVIGRGREAQLRVPDPEPRVSSAHLMIEFSGGRWFVQDISRNGSWLRDGRSGEVALLPYCNKTLLPPAGTLCLGRPFEEDPAEQFVVRFEIGES